MNTEELFVNIDDLPETLSEEQFLKLYIDFKNGNLFARAKIIEHNIKLVIFLVNKKYNVSYYDKKEIVSIGNIGLIKAVDSYDINKNVKFSSYALKCINNEILMYLRENKKKYNIISLEHEFINTNDDEKFKVMDFICNDLNIEEEYINNEIKSFIRDFINTLPNRDKEIILMNFGFYDDVIYSQRDIAKKLNLTQAYISKLIYKSLNTIKKNMEANGFVDKNTKKLIK